ncbi:hypothetical protein B0J13DRAFT_499347 [Dactylonectria estremocensis]|uniref:Uncharacterized protein n=1 Tax=Dactylonectria estremocensis TaxID=1079267 RepID=A0A9P9J9G5_9HYPO|nr:hypothetical protein B0J13DRAFT_499347 [Dactylonectria estremocensis]
MSSSAESLRSQWANPGDILSILLLIGGDIVQKAIAQLVGHQVRLPGTKTHLSIAPVAFSFGWATYAFSNLLAAVGNMRLMPTSDCPSVLVNCSNGFVRDNRSWVLGRLLRDHEIRHNVDPRGKDEGGRAESIRIDIFHLDSISTTRCDLVWWLGWATLVSQLAIVGVPWALYGDWTIMLVTLSGTTLVAVTCAMPQWTEEKWAVPSKLERDKVTCLTRGNGHLHIMVLIGTRGSWDLETLATRSPVPRTETRWISLILAILWICLLIVISGLKEHTWFLIGIGGLGMLQNILAAGFSRRPGASNFHLTKFQRAPTIIGRRQHYKDDADAKINLEEDLEGLADLESWASTKSGPQSLNTANLRLRKAPPMPQWLASMSKEEGVPAWLHALKPDHAKETVIHGALMELEKWVPTAGLSMLQVFFPVGLEYKDESIRDNVHKKFWRRAYHTKSIRKRAEQRRRAEEKKTWIVEEV